MKINYHLLTIFRIQPCSKQQKQPPHSNIPKRLLLKASSYLSIGQNRNRKNMYRKPGHHHEWKDCPDSPCNKNYNRNNNESKCNERGDDSRDEKEIEDR